MRFGPGALKDAAVGAGREAWAVSAALAQHHRRFSAPVAPVTARATWKTEAVVLVHGLGHNDGAWSTLGARLGAAGFFEFTPVTYGLDDDVPRIAEHIAERVDALAGARPDERVHLIGHSLGGVAIRYWYDILGGDTRADAVVTLGAPHLGTMWTRLPFVVGAARDLAVDSSVARRLRGHDVRHDRWTTIGGTFDVVVPPWRAHLPDAENVNVPVGHVGLLTSKAAAGHVCMALLHAEDQRAAMRQVAARGGSGAFFSHE